MLWEGGWEWARLTKSKYISIEVTCPPPPPPPFLLLVYIYTPPPPFWGYARMLSPPVLLRSLLRSLLRPLKICIPFVAVPKKSKKRQAKTLLLQNRSTPIALAARPAGFFSFSIFQFSIKNLSFRQRLSLKSRKNVKRKHVFQKFAFGCGLSLKSRKNVKRKHYF